MSFERPASRNADRDRMPSIPSQSEADKLRELPDEAPARPDEDDGPEEIAPIPNPVEL